MRPMLEFVKKWKGKDKPLIGVELGVGDGRNAMSMVQNLNLEALYLVDIWEPYQENKRKETRYFQQYDTVIKKFRPYSNVHILRNETIKAVKEFKDNVFDFIYIDANHQYESVLLDITLWFPKVKSRGVIGGHDYSGGWSCVVNAVNFYVEDHNLAFTRHYPDWWIINL